MQESTKTTMPSHGKASKAVASTLAGVLAVGLVPAAALADEAPEVQDEASLELLTQDGKTAFAAGTVTLSNGKDYTNDKTVKIAGDGKAHKLTVEKVVPNGTTSAAKADTEYTVTYLQGLEESEDTEENFKTSYRIVIEGNDVESTGAKYAGGVITINVEISTSKLAGASLYEYSGDQATTSDDVSDTDFAFSGAAAKLNLAVNGIAIDPTKINAESGGDYGLIYRYKNTGALVGEDGKNAPTFAGSYVAVVTSLKGDTKDQVAEIPFEIGAIDLSEATITIPDQVVSAEWSALPAAVKVNGKSIEGEGAFTVTRTSGPAGDTIYNTVGEYGATVVLTTNFGGENAAGWRASVLNSGSVTFNKVGSVLEKANVFYDGAAATDKTGAENSIKLSSNQSYDLSKISVCTDPSEETKEYLATDEFEVSVMDEDGNIYTGASAQSQLAEPGNYTVMVKVLPGSEYELGGGGDIAVTVVRETTANVAMSFNGVAGNEFTATYNGEDQLSKLQIVVRDAKKNVLTEGTDYDVKITSASGVVTEAVSVNEYAITVVGKNGYTISEGTATLTIGKIQANLFKLNGTDLFVSDTQVNGLTGESLDLYSSFIPYTGSAITPVISFAVGATADAFDDAAEKVTAKTDWKELDSDAYKLKIEYKATETGAYKVVDEIKDEGFYKLTISTATTEEADNYTVAPLGWYYVDETPLALANDPGYYLNKAASLEIEVRDERKFQDVTGADWFYDAVNTAADNGYMNGYAGTKLFGPNDTMTRGQMAVVLYNMAGGDTDETDGQTASDLAGSYNTKFTDVDGKAYYAKAVQWGVNRGIISGYSETTFAPNDPVTREQFATFLQRYAKAMGKDVTATGDLSAYADAAAVDSWATDAVKWAVANNIMGVNTSVLTPTKSIVRAEAAAMATRYQPKAL